MIVLCRLHPNCQAPLIPHRKDRHHHMLSHSTLSPGQTKQRLNCNIAAGLSHHISSSKCWQFAERAWCVRARMQTAIRYERPSFRRRNTFLGLIRTLKFTKDHIDAAPRKPRPFRCTATNGWSGGTHALPRHNRIFPQRQQAIYRALWTVFDLLHQPKSCWEAAEAACHFCCRCVLIETLR